jgi:F0F1-type ATP synthase assembly protein I
LIHTLAATLPLALYGIVLVGLFAGLLYLAFRRAG